METRKLDSSCRFLRMFAALDDLFGFPKEKREKHKSEKPFRGHYSDNKVIESVVIDDATGLEEARNFAKIFWPNGNDQFRSNGDKNMIFDYYRVEKNYRDLHIEPMEYVLKFTRYKLEVQQLPQKLEPYVAIGEHQDLSFTTIIHENNVNGLDIKTKNGDWTAFHGSPSCFIVMASNALQFGDHLLPPLRLPQISVCGGSSPSASSMRFSLDHQISPNRSISVGLRSNQVVKRQSNQKRTCRCSPTNHPGYFRCSFHKSFRNSHSPAAPAPYSPNRLNARRSAMTNSVVRIGGVEGDLMKRALAALAFFAPAAAARHLPAEVEPTLRHIQSRRPRFMIASCPKHENICRFWQPADLLKMVDRADWRNCTYSKEEETKMGNNFKSQFQEFDPTK